MNQSMCAKWKRDHELGERPSCIVVHTYTCVKYTVKISFCQVYFVIHKIFIGFAFLRDVWSAKSNETWLNWRWFNTNGVILLGLLAPNGFGSFLLSSTSLKAKRRISRHISSDLLLWVSFYFPSVSTSSIAIISRRKFIWIDPNRPNLLVTCAASLRLV